MKRFISLTMKLNLQLSTLKKLLTEEKDTGKRKNNRSHNPSTSPIVALTIACFSVECIQDTSTRFLTRSMQKKATSPGWLFFLFRSIMVFGQSLGGMHICFTACLLLNRSHCMGCTGGAVNSSLSQQETLCLCPTNTKPHSGI